MSCLKRVRMVLLALMIVALAEGASAVGRNPRNVQGTSTIALTSTNVVDAASGKAAVNGVVAFDVYPGTLYEGRISVTCKGLKAGEIYRSNVGGEGSPAASNGSWKDEVVLRWSGTSLPIEVYRGETLVLYGSLPTPH